MPSLTSVLGLQNFVAGDTVDLVTHVSTTISTRLENLFTGAANPAGAVTVAFGTITADNGLRLTGTWNAGGTTFTALRVNYTDTASAAASLLADLQTGGASQWKVTKGGAVTQAGALTVTAGGITVTAGGVTVTAGGATLSAGVLTVPNGTAGAPPYTFSGGATAGVYSPGTNIVSVTTASTERLRVDASGNVGVGVTPSAWGSGAAAVQVGALGVMSYVPTGTTTSFKANSYWDGTNNRAIATAAASTIDQSGGQILMYTAPSVAAGAVQTLTAQLSISNLGNVAIGAAVNDLVKLTLSNAQSSAGVSEYCIDAQDSPTVTSGTAPLFAGVVSGGATLTINVGATLTRKVGCYIRGATATVNGTLTNNNTLYLETPTNGTTVRVIDTVSGATLTTAGVWTNNPSWARYKTDIRYVPRDEVARLYDWFREGWKPARYRHDGTPLDEGGPAPTHQDYEYDSLFALLDDMPEDVREVICADPQGGISTKDCDGLLFALLQEATRRIAALETEKEREAR